MDRIFYNRRGSGILLMTAKVIVGAIATVIIIGGCSPTRSMKPTPSVLSSEKSPSIPLEHERERTTVEQASKLERKQAATPTYLPCNQGPEALRFVDRLGVGTRELTLEGDKLDQLVDRMPPLTQQRFMKMVQELVFEADVTGRRVIEIPVLCSLDPWSVTSLRFGY